MRVQRSTVTSCGAWALRLYCCNVVGARPPDLLAIFGRQSLYVYRLKFLSSAGGARALGWCPYPRISTRALRFQNRTGSVDGPWNSGPQQGGCKWAQSAIQPNAVVGQLRPYCISFLLDLRARPEKDLLLLSLISNPVSRHFVNRQLLHHRTHFQILTTGHLQALPGGGAYLPTFIQSYSRLGLLLCTGISRQRHEFSGLPTYCVLY